MIRNNLTSLFLSLVYASSAIDPIREHLEAESAKWFRGAWISGIVVALGCMFEIWEIVFDLRNWRRYRKKQNLAPDNPGSWMYPIAALGLFLVVGGIVSETIFEVLASNSDAAIRSHESDVLSEAEAKTAIADRKAEDAENEAGELHKATLPRTFDPQKVASKIGGFGNIGTSLCAVSGFESQHTLALIRSALGRAGWTGPQIPSAEAGGDFSELSTPGVWVEVSPMPESSPGPHVGMIITHSPKERARESKRLNRAANALVSALNAQGLEAWKRPLTARGKSQNPEKTIPQRLKPR
jgi:hypothetical protein